MTSEKKTPMPPIPEGREVEFTNQVAREQLTILRRLSDVLAGKIADLDAVLSAEQDFGIHLTRKLSGVHQGINAVLGGAGENKIRHRVAVEMFGSPQQPEEVADPEASSPPERRNVLSAGEEAQLLVDQEAIQARTRYEEDRERLLSALRSADTKTEKQPIIAELDKVESTYSKLWRRLESGARGVEILKAVQERRRPDKPQGRQKPQGRARPQRRAQASSQKGPVTRIKQRGDRSGFAEVMRELDDARWRDDIRERKRRQFQSMTHRHPFKTNSVADDRLYQTHGVRNPRAKKDLR